MKEKILAHKYFRKFLDFLGIVCFSVLVSLTWGCTFENGVFLTNEASQGTLHENSNETLKITDPAELALANASETIYQARFQKKARDEKKGQNLPLIEKNPELSRPYILEEPYLGPLQDLLEALGKSLNWKVIFEDLQKNPWVEVGANLLPNLDAHHREELEGQKRVVDLVYELNRKIVGVGLEIRLNVAHRTIVLGRLK
ncbi:MAG: hypothetical protein LBF22_10530 [Deltaproteobacteria bacterium]|nr:hypothetical protein [Deltaproteobacteria bacterium]